MILGAFSTRILRWEDTETPKPLYSSNCAKFWNSAKSVDFSTTGTINWSSDEKMTLDYMAIISFNHWWNCNLLEIILSGQTTKPKFGVGSDPPFIFDPPFWVSPSLNKFPHPPFQQKFSTRSIKPYILKKPLDACSRSSKRGLIPLFLYLSLKKS